MSRTDQNVVLNVHPEEWRKQWFQMIPGGRLCDPAELKGVSVASLKRPEEAKVATDSC